MGKDAVENNRFKFVSWKIVDANKKRIAHNVLSINLKVDKNTRYYYSQFMAPANQAELGSWVHTLSSSF